jgi:hypothetical protein
MPAPERFSRPTPVQQPGPASYEDLRQSAPAMPLATAVRATLSPSRWTWLAALVVATLLAVRPLEASVKRFCDVSYLTAAGWSRDVRVEVEFRYGLELNRDVRGGTYNQLGNFALVWFSDQTVAILEFQGLALVPPTGFDAGAFRQMFLLGIPATFIQVNAADRRKWQIKGKDALGRFIDPRAGGPPARGHFDSPR